MSNATAFEGALVNRPALVSIEQSRSFASRGLLLVCKAGERIFREQTLESLESVPMATLPGFPGAAGDGAVESHPNEIMLDRSRLSNLAGACGQPPVNGGRREVWRVRKIEVQKSPATVEGLGMWGRV